MEPTREIRLFLEYVTLAQQMREVLNNFAEMPFFNPVIEDEVHVLRTCSLYEDYRHRLSQRAKTCIFVNLEELFTDASLIRETAKFLVRANSRHFFKLKNFSCTLFICLFICLLICSLMYSQDESVRALIDKFMFNPVHI